MNQLIGNASPVIRRGARCAWRFVPFHARRPRRCPQCAHQENPDSIPIRKGSDVDSFNQDCSAAGANAILYPVFN
jgi:hypothetical protein